MSGFDIFLLLIIAGFAFYGLFHGLIKTIGAIVALIVGVWVANLFYLPVYTLAAKLFFGSESLGHFLTFFILFVITNRLVNFLFVLINSSYNSLFFIPFLKTLNRLLGAIFGLVLGGLLVGLILYGLGQMGFWAGLLKPYLKNSQIAPFLLKYMAIIVPLLPNLWEKIKSYKDIKAPDNLDLKGVKLDSFDLDSLKNSAADGFLNLKGKVWNTSK